MKEKIKLILAEIYHSSQGFVSKEDLEKATNDIFNLINVQTVYSIKSYHVDDEVKEELSEEYDFLDRDECRNEKIIYTESIKRHIESHDPNNPETAEEDRINETAFNKLKDFYEEVKDYTFVIFY